MTMGGRAGRAVDGRRWRSGGAGDSADMWATMMTMVTMGDDGDGRRCDDGARCRAQRRMGQAQMSCIRKCDVCGDDVGRAYGWWCSTTAMVAYDGRAGGCG